MLKLVVFMAGGVLMALEITGSRLLAPYFGSSIFVWGSLISIFLAGLSIGYYIGGVVADRHPSLHWMGAFLCVPALFIFLLPSIAATVNQSISLWDVGPRLNPLLATTILFFLPSVFLGTISPYAIKLEAVSLATVGNTAGGLYAISTAGSIGGTLFTAFFLIPQMGVSNILRTLGLILFCLAALLFFRATKYKGQTRAPVVSD